MSVTVFTYIHCNKCGECLSPDIGHLTATEQRKQMRAQGWVYTYNKDLCPNCRPKTKAGNFIKSSKRRKNETKQQGKS